MPTRILAVCATLLLTTACAPAPAPAPPPATTGAAPPITDPSRLVWQRVAPDPSVFGAEASTMPFGAVAAADGGAVLAVGVDRDASPARAAVWTTPDGFTWTRVAPDLVPTAATGASTAMRDVIHVGGRYVAVGFEFESSGADVPASTASGDAPIGRTSAATWTSTDGTRWSRSDAGGDTASVGNAIMTRVAAAGPGLVALGEDAGSGDGIVWTSTDAATWTRVGAGSGLGAAGGAARYLAVADVAGAILVAGSVRRGDGRDAAVWRSVDAGATWTPIESTSFRLSAGQEVAALLTGPWGVVAAGAATEQGTDAAAVWNSPDGLAWTRVAHDEDVFGGAGGDAMLLLRRVGGGILGLGRASPGRLDPEAAVWTSSDGRDWRREPAPADVFGGQGTEEFLTAAQAGNRVVATGRSQQADRDRLRLFDRELLLWFAEARQ